MNNDEELLFKISKKLGFNYYEYDMFIHDVRNLRGNEYLEMIKELGDPDLTAAFKEVARIQEDYDDEDNEETNL